MVCSRRERGTDQRFKGTIGGGTAGGYAICVDTAFCGGAYNSTATAIVGIVDEVYARTPTGREAFGTGQSTAAVYADRARITYIATGAAMVWIGVDIGAGSKTGGQAVATGHITGAIEADLSNAAGAVAITAVVGVVENVFADTAAFLHTRGTGK